MCLLPWCQETLTPSRSGGQDKWEEKPYSEKRKINGNYVCTRYVQLNSTCDKFSPPVSRTLPTTPNTRSSISTIYNWGCEGHLLFLKAQFNKNPPKIKKRNSCISSHLTWVWSPINPGSLASKTVFCRHVIIYKLWTNTHPDRMVLQSTAPVANNNTVGLTLFRSSSEN